MGGMSVSQAQVHPVKPRAHRFDVVDSPARGCVPFLGRVIQPRPECVHAGAGLASRRATSDGAVIVRTDTFVTTASFQVQPANGAAASTIGDFM